MHYDLFISYSRRDDERGQVTALKAQIESSFRGLAGRDLRVFFDTQEIAGMDDWRQRIQRSLRDSLVFLAVLSPRYLGSPFCHWEWEDYVRYEAMHQCLAEGIAPVVFVTLPDAADPNTDQTIGRWINEIHNRQTFDLRPWYDAGESALQHEQVRQTLDQLNTSVGERLRRAECSRSSANNLIKHNVAFVGRVGELTKLRNALTKNKLGVVGAREGQMPGRATVQGLGGMGKTELSLAYAHAFAWDYPGGRWQIPCEYVNDLRVALLHLANVNALNFEFTEDEKKDVALAFERVLRELNRRNRCLLILDNVSDPNLLQPEYLDRLPRDGRADLIATTRLAPRAIPGGANEHEFIAVDELPEEDSLALMRSHQPEGRFVSQLEDDEARAIVKLLRGFTLAVETAAIYLGRDTTPDACRRFRERLSPDLLRESEAAATDPTVAVRHRVRSLEETLAFTLQMLTPEAMHLLSIASLLPADQIALPWLRAVDAEKFHELDRELLTFNLRQAEDLLLGLRLFQNGGVKDGDGNLLVARMHRLVQELVANRETSPQTQLLEKLVAYAETRCEFLREGWLQWANRWEMEPLRAFTEKLLTIKHIRSSYIANELALPLNALALYPQAESLMRRALEISEQEFGPNHPDISAVLNNLALLLQATNRLTEAEPLMRRALQIVEHVFNRDHPNVATSLNSLAHLLQATNRLTEAEPLMNRVVAIMERSHGPYHPNTATALNNLAGLLRATNRPAEAEPLLRRALSIGENYFGPEHPQVGALLNNIAQFLQDTNRLDEAEPLMHRVIGIWEKCLGPKHPQVGMAIANLAQLLQAVNRVPEAESLTRRGLAILEENLGPDHPQVAVAIVNLAGLLQAANRLDEAEPLLRRALAIDEQSYGPQHPDVAISLNNLAGLLKATDRLLEAEPLLRRSLAIREASFGSEHPRVATALDNLAQLLQATDRLVEAEQLMCRALTIWEKSAGPDHPATATCLNNLGQLLKATNRQERAEALLRRALAIDERNFQPHHPDIARDLNNLGELLRTTNRLGEAEPLIRRALAIWETSLGPDHPNLLYALKGLSELLISSNQLGEAERLLRRALEISEKTFGMENLEVAKFLAWIAHVLQVTNRLNEAEPLLHRVLAIYEQNLGPEHPDVAIALNNLGHLLKSTKRHDQSEPLYRRALVILERSLGPNHPNVASALNNLAQLLKATNRFEEAEPLMRRAFVILEESLGPEHPQVGASLNNLSRLLQATNRLAEVEPLMRRHLEIFLRFSQESGHPHPQLFAKVENYAGLLEAMGMNEAHVKRKINALFEAYPPASGSILNGGNQQHLKQKLMALLSEIQVNPKNMKEILLRVKTEDPQLYQTLLQVMQQRK